MNKVPHIISAYITKKFTNEEIAAKLNLKVKTVSRVINEFKLEEEDAKEKQKYHKRYYS